MKAVTWQRWITIAVGALVLAIAVQPVLATQPLASAPSLSSAQSLSSQDSVMPGLPSGLPQLPRLGETMQRDTPSGFALHGYDPVAYQLLARATPGRPDYELVHGGVVWRFASAANREAFRDAPDVYEPAFAGFDATGVADGRAVESDPHLFAVINSRLYLFRTGENRRRFLNNAALFQLAEAQWRDVYGTIARY
ncbi:YHS domain-containing (seleno)protein [Bosea sp. 685]|uniref:YHS domain-containing (seleno)protein n=1 Tax=Bosea sp. 685 TaxID=3080057 RepID=UPI0028929B0A|nr:YHS domain-containing (seleno)protein [Bosea sp. 685]WNJ92052.1 YHS domain-containing (seleno)protein [Bosea sp. 685]